jgi:hypothetical protein
MPLVPHSINVKLMLSADGAGVCVAKLTLKHGARTATRGRRLERSFIAGHADECAITSVSAALALLGRLEEAQRAVDRLLALLLEMTIVRARRHVEIEMMNQYSRQVWQKRIYMGLRLAGLPE